MRRIVKSILGIVFSLFMFLMMTGCEDILGKWEKPAPVVVPASDIVSVSCAIINIE